LVEGQEPEFRQENRRAKFLIFASPITSSNGSVWPVR
jgi:hypothetical protein